MPLTEFQRTILALVARTRAPDSYLAGGAALHFSPKSIRYSNDLDFFHDSAERVASAFDEDLAILEAEDFRVEVVLSQPGFIRAIVSKGDHVTRIDWAHDSAWRFMPPVRDELGGFVLHDVDLGINKTLALAGRDEPRDYVDIIDINERILPLGALCWAAAGKDPGFTPLSLLELLKRRGRHRADQIARLHLREPFDLVAAKETWLEALDHAGEFIESRPSDDLGCLYYSVAEERFVAPPPDADLKANGIVRHFGSPGGVLPQPAED